MTTAVRTDHQLRRAPAASLLWETGASATDQPGHSAIRQSWQRSIGCGLTRATALPAHRRRDEVGDSSLLRAARAVITDRTVAATGRCAIVVTDPEGVVVGRWSADASFQAVLDRLRIDVGSEISEETVGTSGAGMALATKAPSMVVGPDHFATAAAGLVSAGAVVHNRSSKRAMGVVSVFADVAMASPFLLCWLEDLAARIEITALAAGPETVLVDSYLRASKGSRRPLLCFSEDVVLANASGARLLAQVGHATLSEAAAHAVDRGPGDGMSVDLTVDGESIELRCSAIVDQGVVRGVVVRHHGAGKSPARPAPATRDLPAPELGGLVGASTAWRRTSRQILEVRDSGEPVILVGELGSGKSAIVEALTAGLSAVETLDASLCFAATVWEEQLARVMGSQGDAIVLENLDALSETEYDRVCRILSARVGSIRVIATARPRATVELSPEDIFDIRGFPGRSIRVPPLRERLEDLPALLRFFTAERLPGRMPPTWRSDAIQAIARVPWSANVSSIKKVVQIVLAKNVGASISMTDLPPRVQALASRRNLSGLERSEAHAITFGLRAFGGNKQATASSLGIARSTLYRKMRALGIDLDVVMY
jgi:sigma-54 dependent transcriptional regulator, acetoin dehydrogenase operon transcriptional activator AcoR